ncbi:MAG TPA: flagellar hook-length control protein FliK [Noviherbaspirillum sp.]
MLPRADIAGARPVASVEATRPIIPTGDAHQELAQRLSKVALGTAFQAEILSRLNDGSFMVKVADTPVRMNLPEGAQAGEKVDLTLVAKQPQPAFQLYRPPTNGSTASVSNAGRLVDWILHAVKDTGGPTALVGKAPLLPSANAAPAQLANAMKDTLTFSGLFYESHLGKWANGEHPLMALMAEPQAKNSDLQKVFTALRAAASADTPPGDIKHAGMAKPGSALQLDAGQLMRLLATLHEHPEMASSLMDSLRAAMQSEGNQPPAQAAPAADTDATPPSSLPSLDALPAAGASLPDTSSPSANTVTTASSQADPNAAARPETMDSESVRMINLQLTTLEQQRVAWQGELWPGQRMEWEIGEETHGRKEGGASQERAWQSVVRMELPKLGAISASVRLAGNALQIQVRAASDTTAALLRQNGNTLSSALDAAGSPLELLTVKRDEAA